MNYVDEHATPNEIHRALQAHKNGHPLTVGYQDGKTYLEVTDTLTGAKVAKWLTPQEEDDLFVVALGFDEDDEI